MHTIIRGYGLFHKMYEFWNFEFEMREKGKYSTAMGVINCYVVTAIVSTAIFGSSAMDQLL